MTLFAFRRLLLRTTREPSTAPVLADALFELFPDLMEALVAEAARLSLRHRTSYVVLAHPNLVNAKLVREARARSGRRWREQIDQTAFVIWPSGYVQRGAARRYRFIEVYRTPHPEARRRRS